MNEPVETPFYDLVPKDFFANLKFRREMIKLGVSDSLAAEELWIMCSRDPLFYINTFVWTYDPRKTPAALPFITYDYQDEAFVEVFRAIGSYDLLTKKSRDMGASWIYIIAPEYLWHFRELQSFLFVSRVQDLVDKTEDPDSLFWKVDFIHKNLPRFLLPGINRTKLHVYNIDNGSTIDGSSTTGDVARGGRRTAILLDEFASVDEGHAVLSATRDATRCRLFNSTPKGVGNAFYDMTQTDIRILRFHWSQHPEKKPGLYSSKDSKLEIIDTDYKFADDYPFILDGKLRSPWYDNECKRAAHPMEIAQELDIDFLGSNYQFFVPAVIEKLQKETVRPPYLKGEIEYDADTLEPLGFTDTEEGRLNLWVTIDAAGKLPAGIDAVLAVDIAAGTGASNSVISIGNRKTSEKVAEFASPYITPHDLAKTAVALAKWFNDGLLIWDAGGHGRIFGNCVIDAGYRKIYYRQNEQSLSRKVSDVPGYFFTKDNKRTTIGEYREALDSGKFINRSYQALRECLEYVYVRSSSSIEHSKCANTIDPTGARDNHGDRVIADALLYKGMKMFSVVEEEEIQVPQNCFLARRQLSLAKAAEETYW